MEEHSAAEKRFANWSQKYKFPVSDKKLEDDVNAYLSKNSGIDMEWAIDWFQVMQARNTGSYLDSCAKIAKQAAEEIANMMKNKPPGTLLNVVETMQQVENYAMARIQQGAWKIGIQAMPETLTRPIMSQVASEIQKSVLKIYGVESVETYKSIVGQFHDKMISKTKELVKQQILEVYDVDFDYFYPWIESNCAEYMEKITRAIFEIWMNNEELYVDNTYPTIQSGLHTKFQQDAQDAVRQVLSRKQEVVHATMSPIVAGFVDQMVSGELNLFDQRVISDPQALYYFLRCLALFGRIQRDTEAGRNFNCNLAHICNTANVITDNVIRLKDETDPQTAFEKAKDKWKRNLLIPQQYYIFVSTTLFYTKQFENIQPSIAEPIALKDNTKGYYREYLQLLISELTFFPPDRFLIPTIEDSLLTSLRLNDIVPHQDVPNIQDLKWMCDALEEDKEARTLQAHRKLNFVSYGIRRLIHRVKKANEVTNKIFKIQRLNDVDSPRVTIAISGLFSESDNMQDHWAKILDIPQQGKVVSLKWEAGGKLKAVKKALFGLGKGGGIGTIEKVLRTSMIIPMKWIGGAVGTIWTIKDFLDIWFSAEKRAIAAGKDLAKTIINTNYFQDHQISLIAFSLGTRVVVECLKELSKLEDRPLIQNVYLLGGATPNSPEKFEDGFQVPHGRIVNAMSHRDKVLKKIFNSIPFKATSIGTSKIEHARVENIDLTSTINGHKKYMPNLDSVLEKINYIP